MAFFAYSTVNSSFFNTSQNTFLIIAQVRAHKGTALHALPQSRQCTHTVQSAHTVDEIAQQNKQAAQPVIPG